MIREDADTYTPAFVLAGVAAVAASLVFIVGPGRREKRADWRSQAA